VLQYHFNWKTLAAVAGVTWRRFYFRLFPGAIRSAQVIEFLGHLLAEMQIESYMGMPLIDAAGGMENLKRWGERMAARPGVQKGMSSR